MAGIVRRSQQSSERSMSLLERMRLDDLQEPPPSNDPFAARISSIRSNLVRLLNARRGLSDSTPDYGLSDFNGTLSGSRDMLRVISLDIHNAITRYEPRASNVSVTFDRRSTLGASLHFQVQVQTAIRDKHEQVTIDLVLKEGRSFELR